MDIMQNLKYKIAGDRGATVVFLNGFRKPFASWDKVYPDIARDNCVLLFNRPGVGASPKATVDQAGFRVVEDIRALLTELWIPPPYVLVAHSLGGLFTNLYARLYPTEVAGLVLVDAPHPSEVLEQKACRPPLIIRAINNGLKSIERRFDRFKYSEDECVEATIQQIRDAGPFPDIPVSVVSGTKKMPFIPEKALIAESRHEIEEFTHTHSSWVIEGCYSDLLEIVIPESTEIIFLDLPIEACISNAKNRPWEPHKYVSKEAQDANLAMLIDWIAQYSERNDTFSRTSHEALFNSYTGKKTRYVSNERI